MRCGQIDTIGTDNIPGSSEEKAGDWLEAGASSGYGTLLPHLLYEGHHKRNFPLDTLVDKMAANPAQVFGWFPRRSACRSAAMRTFSS